MHIVLALFMLITFLNNNHQSIAPPRQENSIVLHDDVIKFKT